MGMRRSCLGLKLCCSFFEYGKFNKYILREQYKDLSKSFLLVKGNGIL